MQNLFGSVAVFLIGSICYAATATEDASRPMQALNTGPSSIVDPAVSIDPKATPASFMRDSFVLPKGVSKDAGERYISSLGVEAIIEQFAPGIQMKDAESIRLVARHIGSIELSGMEALDKLRIEKGVRHIMLDSAFIARNAKPTDEMRKKILLQVDQVFDATENAIRTHLKDKIKDEDMNALRKFHVEILTSGIDNLSRYSLKTAAAPEVVDEVVKFIDSRVISEVPSITELLNRGEKDRVQTWMENVFRRVAKSVMDFTSNPELKKMKADEISPGYSEMLKKLGAAEKENAELERMNVQFERNQQAWFNRMNGPKMLEEQREHLQQTVQQLDLSPAKSSHLSNGEAKTAGGNVDSAIPNAYKPVLVEAESGRSLWMMIAIGSLLLIAVFYYRFWKQQAAVH
jgi:hypothetical protein